MFVGHTAIALAAKSRAPTVSLGWLLVAAFVLDLLWPFFSGRSRAGGGADKLVDPDGASLLHDLVGSVDKTLRVYEGLYDEVYNEPERGQVLRDAESWLASHIAGSGK